MLVGVSYDTVRFHMENMRKQKIIARNGNGSRFAGCVSLGGKESYRYFNLKLVPSVIDIILLYEL